MTCTLANRRPGIKTDFQTKGRKSKYRIQNTLFITEGITLPPASHISLGVGSRVVVVVVVKLKTLLMV